jgi:hypothetical protein
MKFLEATNAFLCVLSVGFTLIFTVLLWMMKERWREPIFSAALAMWLFNAGLGVRQAIFWYGRRLYPEDQLWTLKYNQFYFILIAIAVTAIGLLWKVQVFSKADFGHGPWVMLLTTAVVCALYTYYL